MNYNLAGKQVKAPGDHGMAGIALAHRRLRREPWTVSVEKRNLLDLRRQSVVESSMAECRPHVVALAVARVGGMRETPRPMTEGALPLLRFRSAQ